MDIKDYRKKKYDLQKIAKDIKDAVNNSEIENAAEKFDIGWLDRIINNISEDNFKIVVIGDFNAGKSTFINALLGNRILIANDIACTEIVTEIKYSDSEEYLVYFNKIDSGKDVMATTPKAEQHINKYRHNTEINGEIPPMKISRDELGAYTCIYPEKKQMHIKRSKSRATTIFVNKMLK